jgi:hypothetical protein
LSKYGDFFCDNLHRADEVCSGCEFILKNHLALMSLHLDLSDAACFGIRYAKGIRKLNLLSLGHAAFSNLLSSPAAAQMPLSSPPLWLTPPPLPPFLPVNTPRAKGYSSRKVVPSPSQPTPSFPVSHVVVKPNVLVPDQDDSAGELNDESKDDPLMSASPPPRKTEGKKKIIVKKSKATLVNQAMIADIQKLQGERDAFIEIDKEEKAAAKRLPLDDYDGMPVVHPWELHLFTCVPNANVPGTYEVLTSADKGNLKFAGTARLLGEGEMIVGEDSYSGYKYLYLPVPGPSSPPVSWKDTAIITICVQQAVSRAAVAGVWNPTVMKDFAYSFAKRNYCPWPDMENDILEAINTEIGLLMRQQVTDQQIAYQQRHFRETIRSRISALTNPTHQSILQQSIDDFVLIDQDNETVIDRWGILGSWVFYFWSVPLNHKCQQLFSWTLWKSALKILSPTSDNHGHISMLNLGLLASCSAQRGAKADLLPGLTMPRTYHNHCDQKPIGIYGCSILNCSITTPLACSHNLYNSYAIRMFFPRTISTPAVLTYISWFRSSFIPQIFSNRLYQFTFDEYCDHLDPSRAKVVRQFSPHSVLTELVMRIQGFNKKEPYVGKDSSNFKPRMINGRDPSVLAVVGPGMYSVDKSAASSFGYHQHCSIDSGFTPEEVAVKAIRCRRKRFLIESDVSNWDGSLAGFFKELELEIFEAFPGDLPWLDDLKTLWKTTNVRGKDGFKAKLTWGRNSGEVVTSIFNSLINLSLVQYCARACGETSPECLVKGDDNFWGTDHFSEDTVRSLYTELGFPKVDLIVREGLHDLEYCSGKFYQVNRQHLTLWKWGVKPFRQISKLGINFNNHSPKTFQRLLRGTAIGMSGIAFHVPLIGPLLRHISKFDVERPIVLPLEPWKNNSTITDDVSFQEVTRFCCENGISVCEYDRIIKSFELLGPQDFPLLWDSDFFLAGFNKECSLSPLQTAEEHVYERKTLRPSASEIVTRAVQFISRFAWCYEEVLKCLFPPLGPVIGLAEWYLTGDVYNFLYHTTTSVVYFLVPGPIPLLGFMAYHFFHNYVLAQSPLSLGTLALIGYQSRPAGAAADGLGFEGWWRTIQFWRRPLPPGGKGRSPLLNVRSRQVKVLLNKTNTDNKKNSKNQNKNKKQRRSGPPPTRSKKSRGGSRRKGSDLGLYAQMISDPCNCVLTPGLYGDIAGIMGRFKATQTVVTSGANSAGYFLWCPTRCNAAGSTSAVSWVSSSAFTNPQNSNTERFGTYTSGFNVSSSFRPAGDEFILSPTLAEFRTLSACVRMLYLGTTSSCSGRVAYIQGLSSSQLLYTDDGPISVTDLFNMATKTQRVSLDTMEVSYRPDEGVSEIFRNDQQPALRFVASSPTIIPGADQAMGDSWFGFAWQGVDSKEFSFETIRNIEWKPKPILGQAIVPPAQVGEPMVRKATQLLDRVSPGWDTTLMQMGTRMAGSAANRAINFVLGGSYPTPSRSMRIGYH